MKLKLTNNKYRTTKLEVTGDKNHSGSNMAGLGLIRAGDTNNMEGESSMEGLGLITTADTNIITAADTNIMEQLVLPPPAQGRSKRRTTQEATAASVGRATATNPPPSNQVRTSSRRRASDSTKKSQDDDLSSTSSIQSKDKDQKGLHFSGYRDSNFTSGLDRDSSNTSPKLTICTCEEVVDDIEVEDLISCSVRDCEVGWFHLKCVGLPGHPPRLLGWMCPECIATQGITMNVKGLFDVKSSENTVRAREWLNGWVKEEQGFIVRGRVEEREREDEKKVKEEVKREEEELLKERIERENRKFGKRMESMEREKAEWRARRYGSEEAAAAKVLTELQWGKW